MTKRVKYLLITNSRALTKLSSLTLIFQSIFYVFLHGVLVANTKTLTSFFVGNIKKLIFSNQLLLTNIMCHYFLLFSIYNVFS